VGYLDFMDADKDGNVIDDGLGIAASGAGTAATFIGGGMATLGGIITSAALGASVPTAGLSDVGGLPTGIGLGLAGGALALGGMALSSDTAVNAAEAFGDFIGGPAIAAGTPAAEPSVADALPAR
jgi:hypothetical protein